MTAGAASNPQKIALPALIAVLVCLILFSEGAFQRLVAPDMDEDGNTILRIMWLPVYAVVAALALTQVRQMTALVVRMPFLTVLVVLASISFVWSIDPSLSMRRGFGVAMTTLFGLYLAARFEWRTLILTLGGLWLGLSVLNFGGGLLAPGFARDDGVHLGAWHGFWFEKNTMGGHMARAALIFGALMLIDSKRIRLWAVGLALSVGLVLLSTSITALLATLLAAGVLLAGWALQGRRAISVIGVWGGVTLAAIISAYIALQPDVVLALFGKDPTLTGRTDIWSALVDAIAQRPLIGYGYGAFWAPDSEPAYWVRAAVDWGAPTAHNGWLEITLALGLIGVTCFTFSFLGTLGRALIRLPDHRFALFAVGFLAQLALFSFSESLLFELNNLVWVTYVAIAGTLVRGLSADGNVARRVQRHPSDLRLRCQPDGLI